jgi:hypothetical protein
MVDAKGFRDFCKKGERVKKGLTRKEIDANLKVAAEFEATLKSKDYRNATKADVERFAKVLVKRKGNDFDSFVALLRYARFCGNEDVEIATLILVDGTGVLPDLAKEVEGRHGAKVKAAVVKGVKFPPIGTSTKELPKTARRFVRNLRKALGDEAARKVMHTGVHAGPKAGHKWHRELYLKEGSVDKYLAARRKDFVETLDKHRREGTLFYNQRIDDDVMDNVRKTPEMEGGQRKGRTIFVVKIPYRAIEYLREKDPKLRRYHFCHCPWARETILTGKELDPEFCNCSAGFTKKPLDVAFDADLEIEVLESVLRGDDRCRFAVKLPKGLK